MCPLQHIQERYFGELLGAFFLIGEQPHVTPTVEYDIDAWSLIAMTSAGEEALPEMSEVAGLFPILVIRYEFFFKEDVASGSVLQYIEDAVGKEGTPFRFSIFFTHEADLSNVLKNFVERIHGIEHQILQEDTTVQRVCGVKRGDQLITVLFALDAIPVQLYAL